MPHDTPIPVGFKLDFACWKAVLTTLWLSISLSASVEPAPKSVEPPLPQFRNLPAMPGLRVAAKATGIALEGISAPANREKMQPGDEAVFLASLTEGKKLTQWVVVLKAEASAEKERAGAGKDHLLYSNTGHIFKFSENKAAVRITVLGPFKASEQQKGVTKQKRVIVTEAFLAMGLHGLPAFALKMKAMQERPEAKGKTVNVNVSSEPFPEDQIDANRQTATLLGVTEDDERALAGTVPRSVSFSA